MTQLTPGARRAHSIAFFGLLLATAACGGNDQSAGGATVGGTAGATGEGGATGGASGAGASGGSGGVAGAGAFGGSAGTSGETGGSGGLGGGPPTDVQFKHLAVSFTVACGVKADDQVRCWSMEDADPNGFEPFPGKAFKNVAIGNDNGAFTPFICGIALDDSVVCLGIQAPAGTFAKISAGYKHACGIHTDGSLECWGDNEFGEVSGNPSYGTPPPPPGPYLDVDAGNRVTCGVLANGDARCWGIFFNPATAPPVGAFVQVVAGDSIYCGIRSSGAIECWGSDYAPAPYSLPNQPLTGLVLTDVSKHGGALGPDGSIIYWENGTVLANVPSGKFIQLAGDLWRACARNAQGFVACWGH